MFGTAHAADKSTVQGIDRKFAENAARAGLAEVEAAKLAQQKASDKDVKEFARQMEADHTRANDELRQLADSKGLALPAEPDGKHKRAIEKLGKEDAAKFDREYMKDQTADHRVVLMDFDRESKAGRDPDLKKWASDKLPLLHHHLDMADTVLRTVAVDEKSHDGAPPKKDTIQK
jgi:putative membrane protein